MGLRFRKSVSLFPGVKLNFGTTGMSVSTGVPGFRKTFHTSGRVTTTVGIPGTGLYYVDTKNPSQQPNRRNSQSQVRARTNYDDYEGSSCIEPEIVDEPPTITHSLINCEDHLNAPEAVVEIDTNSLKSIHKSSDDSIDWTEVLVSPLPPDDSYNQGMWQYYHSMASKVLSGDIDTYLQLIYEVNPLDDLLAYGGNYEFGTDDPCKIEVEFSVNENTLASAKKQMSAPDYNNLMQDFICSVCIRIARDMFALLPVAHTIVHALLNERTVVSVDFDRNNLSKVKFGYVDPSDTIALFKYNMNYCDELGFRPVTNLG